VATDKLHEGIRNFAVDLESLDEKLRGIIANVLDEDTESSQGSSPEDKIVVQPM
jgi:hypothetical protein